MLFLIFVNYKMYNLYFYDFIKIFGVFFFLYKQILKLMRSVLIFSKLSQKAIYFSFFSVVYTYILNLCTAIPFFYPLFSFNGTSIFFTLVCFFGSLLVVLLDESYSFFGIFTCTSTPEYLIEMFTAINVVSYLIRFFSLTIRVFASSCASTILLHVIGNIALFFFFYVQTINSFFCFLFSCLFLFFITILEFITPLLQAQIFNFLCFIYFNEAIINSKTYFSFFSRIKKEQLFNLCLFI